MARGLLSRQRITQHQTPAGRAAFHALTFKQHEQEGSEMQNRIDRRVFVIGSVASAALLASKGGAAAAGSIEALKGSGKVVVCTWGGSYTDAQIATLFKPFTEAEGISVTTTGTPDVAKMKLMVESGNVEWDMVDAEAQM